MAVLYFQNLFPAMNIKSGNGAGAYIMIREWFDTRTLKEGRQNAGESSVRKRCAGRRLTDDSPAFCIIDYKH